jgi:hypothetical protein
MLNHGPSAGFAHGCGDDVGHTWEKPRWRQSSTVPEFRRDLVPDSTRDVWMGFEAAPPIRRARLVLLLGAGRPDP